MPLFKRRVKKGLGENEYPQGNKNRSENSVILLHRLTKSGGTRLGAPASSGFIIFPRFRLSPSLLHQPHFFHQDAHLLVAIGHKLAVFG